MRTRFTLVASGSSRKLPARAQLHTVSARWGGSHCDLGSLLSMPAATASKLNIGSTECVLTGGLAGGVKRKASRGTVPSNGASFSRAEYEPVL